jgi:hypothetical protein
MIYEIDGTGILDSDGSNNQYFYNTAYSEGYRIYSNYGAANVTIKNNIFYQVNDGFTAAISFFDAPLSAISSDYNDLYAPNSYVGMYENTYCVTLAEFQAATNLDMHSISINPIFVDPIGGNLHIDTLTTSPVDSAGIPIAHIITDFDREYRDPNFGSMLMSIVYH